MSPEGEHVLRDTYQRFAGHVPAPDMEHWEIVRDLMYWRFHGKFPELPRGQWQHCMRVIQEELDHLDPQTAVMVEDEIIRPNAMAGAELM